MKPRTFERSVVLPASIEEVFTFHSNPRNIGKISPPSLRVLRVEAEPVARQGGEFRFHVRQFGVPMRWHGRWDRVEPPRLAVDVSRASPFKFWRHSHIFEPAAAGTRMTDRVEYSLTGTVIGDAILALPLRLFFVSMFRTRHSRTVAWFERIEKRRDS